MSSSALLLQSVPASRQSGTCRITIANRIRVRCARIAVEASLAVNGPGRLWLCPVNEPSFYSSIAGMPERSRRHGGHHGPRYARSSSRCRILTNDPITGVGEHQFEATDAIVSAVCRCCRDQLLSSYRSASAREGANGNLATLPQAKHGVGNQLA